MDGVLHRLHSHVQRRDAQSAGDLAARLANMEVPPEYRARFIILMLAAAALLAVHRRDLPTLKLVRNSLHTFLGVDPPPAPPAPVRTVDPANDHPKTADATSDNSPPTSASKHDLTVAADDADTNDPQKGGGPTNNSENASSTATTGNASNTSSMATTEGQAKSRAKTVPTLVQPTGQRQRGDKSQTRSQSPERSDDSRKAGAPISVDKFAYEFATRGSSR